MIIFDDLIVFGHTDGIGHNCVLRPARRVGPLLSHFAIIPAVDVPNGGAFGSVACCGRRHSAQRRPAFPLCPGTARLEIASPRNIAKSIDSNVIIISLLLLLLLFIIYFSVYFNCLFQLFINDFFCCLVGSWMVGGALLEMAGRSQRREGAALRHSRRPRLLRPGRQETPRQRVCSRLFNHDSTPPESPRHPLDPPPP